VPGDVRPALLGCFEEAPALVGVHRLRDPDRGLGALTRAIGLRSRFSFSTHQLKKVRIAVE
jgi:hypothetical protein